MKPNNETDTDRLAWAKDVCARLERSAKCYEFWDKAIDETRGWPAWRVIRRWGSTRKRLIKKRQSAFDDFLEDRLLL